MSGEPVLYNMGISLKGDPCECHSRKPRAWILCGAGLSFPVSGCDMVLFEGRVDKLCNSVFYKINN